MRLILLVLTFFWGITEVISQTEVYYPIPETNAIWNEEAWWIVWLNPPCTVHDQYTLFFSGDTLIGTFNYKKTYASGFIGAPPCQPPGHYYFNEYRGAFRQDSALKKVFFIKKDYLSEDTIYDFNMNIGDTIYNNGYNQVVDIDSVIVGTEYHKRYLLLHLSQPPNIPDTNYAIIEGIGSTLGLYQPIRPFFEGGSQLDNFCRYGLQLYPSSNDSCKIITGISVLYNLEFIIDVFPNPLSSQTILSTNQLLQNATLLIFNCFGQTVKQINNINGNTHTIKRDRLPNGIYILFLTNNERTFKEKLIIID
ncbi:T9SS type A sorting domain-containing protein [candidate division KSB1 bacterium]